MNSLKLKPLLKFLLAIVAISSLFFASCKKDMANESVQNAIKEPTPKEQAESLINMNYRYLKYYFGQKKPEDYIHESLRKEIKESHAKIKSEYAGLSAEETIRKMESESAMSKEMAQAMLELKSVADALESVKTIKELEDKFLSFETKIYNNQQLKDDEKIIIATTSGTLRSVMKYLDEIEQGPDDDKKYLSDGTLKVRSGCLWGKKLLCYANIIVKTGGGAWKGVKSPPLLGVDGAIIGAAFGFLEGLISLFKDDCKCGDTPDPCFTPIGINVIFSNNNPCNGNVRFATWGIGSQPSTSNGQTLRWTIKAYNADGTLYNNAPIADNIPEVGTTLMSLVNIPNPNLNLEVIVTRICSDGEKGVKFLLNLRELLDDPGSVIISGSANAFLWETITYNLNGECLINPNNQHQWFIPSQATLVSGGGGGTSARVTWNTRTCSGSSSGGSGWGGSGGCFRPNLSVRSTSACSGNQSFGWLGVGIR